MNELDHDQLAAITGGAFPTCTFDPETLIFECKGDTGPFLF